jgi:hypothetical protein
LNGRIAGAGSSLISINNVTSWENICKEEEDMNMWWTRKHFLCNIYGKKGEGDEVVEVEGGFSGPRDCGWPISWIVEGIVFLLGSGYSQVQYLQIKTTSQVQYLQIKTMSQVQ